MVLAGSAARAESFRSDRYDLEQNRERQVREREHLRFNESKDSISEEHRQWAYRLERDRQRSTIARQQRVAARLSSLQGERIKEIDDRQTELREKREAERMNPPPPRWDR